MRCRAKDNQRGFVTVEFVAGVAFLLLPVALLVMTLPIWSERQTIARVAARESAREYVLTNSQQQARNAALLVTNNGKLRTSAVQVSFEGDPRSPGSSVRSTVTVEIPAFTIPILGASDEGFTLSESHAEVVDQYRSLVQ